MDVNSLSHTRWECKYHILFAPKFRRKVAYGELKQDIANILSMLCKRKGVEIIEAEICPDHVHMLVRIPPSMSVSKAIMVPDLLQPTEEIRELVYSVQDSLVHVRKMLEKEINF